MQLIKYAVTGLCLLSTSVMADPKAFVGGESRQIQSNHLERQMEVKVYLPDDYQTTGNKYPVIYVLDGKRYAQMAAGMQQSLSHFNRMPKAIVVGVNFIKGEEQQRRRWLSRQSDAFLDYLQKEVTVTIDKHYRSNDDRVFFGWQQAGNLGLKAIAQRPGLFDGVISASMTYMEEDASPVNLLKQYYGQTQPKEATYFYSAIAKSENWIEPDFAEAEAFMAQQKSTQLTMVFDVYEQEDHWSTAHLTLYRGLRSYYKDFEPLNFTDMAAIKKGGGLDAVLKHYAKRAKRFGVPNKVEPNTQFSMLMSAYKAKDFAAFDQFMTAFDDFIETTPLPRWGHLFGQYYLDNGKADKAMALFVKNQKKFSDEPVVYADFGDVYVKQGKLNKAKTHYLKALEIAKAKKDNKLSTYQDKLNSLTAK